MAASSIFSDPVVSKNIWLASTVAAVVAVVLALVFGSYKLIKHVRKTRQPQTDEECTMSRAPGAPPLQAPAEVLDWAGVIEETVGGHPDAQPYSERVWPAGYLSYIHLPVSFPSLPSTARVAGLYVRHQKPKAQAKA